MESWDFLFANNDEYVIDFAMCQMKAIIGTLHVENAECLEQLSVTLSPYDKPMREGKVNG